MGLDIRNVTFANNSAAQQGGALWLEANLPASIVNSTFSANTVSGDAGGAMFLNNRSAPVNITNSTIAYNSAGRADGALWMSKNHNVTLKNSIVAFNRAERDRKQDQVGYTPKDGGGNLEFSTNSKAIRVFSKGTFADPRLSALKSVNGTLIHVLNAGSPAINAGVIGGAPKTDQRGVRRDRRVDIGSFEFNPNTTPKSPVTPNSSAVLSQPTPTSPVKSQPTPTSPVKSQPTPNRPGTPNNNNNVIDLQASKNILDGTSNIQEWGAGVSLYGESVDGSREEVIFGRSGFAVKGNRYDKQVDYDPLTGKSERLVLNFEEKIKQVAVELGLMGISEWKGLPETGKWIAYDDQNRQVDSGIFDPTKASEQLGKDQFVFEVESSSYFSSLAIEATAYGSGNSPYSMRDDNNSDFNLRGIGISPDPGFDMLNGSQ